MRDLTIQDVIDKRMVHPLGGYQSRFEIGEYEVSIVGGRHGLYGDFETTFELAIFDKNGEFVTEKFINNGNGDVEGWLDKEQLMDIINSIP